MTLKRRNRICNRYEYWLLRRYGVSRQFKYFYLNSLVWANNPLAKKISTPESDSSISRLGVIITRKFDKKAVTRNKIKRYFKRAFIENIDKFPQGTWLVINPRAICRGVTYEELNFEFTKAIQEVFVTGSLRY
jgi:ribonuclease P protein component